MYARQGVDVENIRPVAGLAERPYAFGSAGVAHRTMLQEKSELKPKVRYARSGDVSIAYQVVGDGPTDL